MLAVDCNSTAAHSYQSGCLPPYTETLAAARLLKGPSPKMCSLRLPVEVCCIIIVLS